MNQLDDLLASLNEATGTKSTSMMKLEKNPSFVIERQNSNHSYNPNPDLQKNVKSNEERIKRNCEHCKEIINEIETNSILIGNRFWHRDHFVCSHCTSSLIGIGNVYQMKKKLFCKNCFEDEGGIVCAYCNEAVKEVIIIQ